MRVCISVNDSPPREAEPARVALHRAPLRQLVELRQLGAGPVAEVGLEQPLVPLHPQPERLGDGGGGLARALQRRRVDRGDLALVGLQGGDPGGHRLGLGRALVGQVQARGAAREHLAGGRGLAVAHEQHERGRRGSGDRSGPWSGANLSSGPVTSDRLRRAAAGRARGGRRAGPAPAWWPGGSRSRPRSGPPFRDEEYWGRPVPGLRRSGRPHRDRRPRPGRPRRQPDRAGCSPATGRATSSTPPCTAPGSPTSRPAPHRDDGLVLTDVWITAPVRCAPPANKPTPTERDTCLPVPRARARAARRPRCSSPSGRSATRACARILGVPPRPRFAHGVEVPLPDGRWILGSYHVSQQNTFTGTLTEPMLDAVLARAKQLAGSASEQGEELAGEVDHRGDAEEDRRRWRAGGPRRPGS